MSLRYLPLLLMRSVVKDLLGEQTRDASGASVETTSAYWSDAELYRYINDAYVEAAKFTKALEIVESIATTASTATYTLSANVGQVIRVAYDDRKVYSTTKWELDRTEPDWENQTGYVSNYMLTQMNNRRIRLYKAPTASGGITVDTAVTGGEYGIIIDIDDGTNTYTFGSEYGEVIETAGTDWTADFAGEYGVGFITGSTGGTGGSNNFEVWATKHPDSLVNALDTPELPYWSHMGIAFRAAAKALEKYGEQGRAEQAAAYNAIAHDYLKLLKGFVSNRAGERTTTMGRPRGKQRRPAVWETLIEE